jgi:hypothetical protein
MPANAGIQYSRDVDVNPRSRSVLDTPLSRGMTGSKALPLLPHRAADLLMGSFLIPLSTASRKNRRGICPSRQMPRERRRGGKLSTHDNGEKGRFGVTHARRQIPVPVLLSCAY